MAAAASSVVSGSNETAGRVAVPVVGEDDGEVLGVQGSVLVGEPDAAVELRVAREAFLQSRHPDQDQAGLAAVIAVAQLLERGGLQAVGLVDDHELDVRFELV